MNSVYIIQFASWSDDPLMNEVVPRDDRHPESVGLPAVILWHEGELVAARLAL